MFRRIRQPHSLAALLAAVLALAVVGAWQPAQAAGNRLNGGQALEEGQQLNSANGQYTLFVGEMVSGQSLTLYSTLCEEEFLVDFTNSQTYPQWSRLAMQTDGNLVQYAQGHGAVWSSGTAGNPGAYAALQDDGNLVVYSAAGRPLYASNTTCSQAWNYDGIVGDVMSGSLSANQYMLSRDRRFKFVMQPDGNLVLYSPTRATWQSGTAGNPGAHFALQWDGNLVVYSASNRVLWTSRTAQGGLPFPPTVHLVLQNDGNLVHYRWAERGSTPLWQSGTR